MDETKETQVVRKLHTTQQKDSDFSDQPSIQAKPSFDKKTSKQRKAEQKEEEFWKGMATRREVSNFIANVMQSESNNLLAYINFYNFVFKELLIEKGIFSEEELKAKIGLLAERLQPKKEGVEGGQEDKQ